MNVRQIKRFERIFKGVANHRRIRILLVIEKNSDITLEGIVEQLESNYHTIAEHVSRLSAAGLVLKKYHGRAVGHTLSPYGLQILKIMKEFKE